MNASPFNESSAGSSPSPTVSVRSPTEPSPEHEQLRKEPTRVPGSWCKDPADEHRLTRFRQHVDDGEHIAFTILQDDDLELEDKNENGDEGIGSAEESCKVRKASDDSPIVFTNSLEDEKTLTAANSSVLRAKLMSLTKSQDTLYQNQKKPEKRQYSVSNSNVSNQTTVSLKTNHSQSHGNLSTKRTYHQNCHVPYQNHSKPAERRQKRSVENPTMSFTNRTAGLNKNVNNMNNRNKQRQSEVKRPVFVTTVKKGTFLEPPPEIAYLLGLGSTLASTNGSNNSLNSSRDRHQQQVMLYSFASQPRVVHHSSKMAATKREMGGGDKNRAKRDVRSNEEEGAIPYGNLMFDRRVVRGNTFAQPVPTQEEVAAARQQEAKRRAMARRRAQGAQLRSSRMRIGTPPPVHGRRHENIQTEKRYEELLYNPTDKEIACQTEFFDDEMFTECAHFVPESKGCEVSTQVYPGDLYDFERAVLPILAELAGTTLEQALMEVMQEDELATLQSRQRRLLEMREVEAQEAKESERMREAALRLHGAARAATVCPGEFLQDSLPSVLRGLRDAGYMIDDVAAETEAGFLPWLVSEVTNEMTHMVNSKDILTDIVREILETRAEIYRVMSEEEEKNLRMSSDDDDEKL